MKALLNSLLISAFILSQTILQAATLTVSNLNDSGAGSLRAAFEAANASEEDDIINVTVTGVLTLTTATNPDLNLLPSISEVTINANGLVLKRGASVYGRFFQISDCSLTGITFDGGNSSLTGGGLFAAGENFITNCLFINNVAGSGDNVGLGSAGAIRIQSGHTTITNSTFTNNQAQNGAAIRNYYNGTLTLNECTFSGNVVDEGDSQTASTIYNEGTLNFSNTIIANTIPQNTPDLYDIGEASKRIGTNENNLVEICAGYGCEPVAFTSDPLLGPLANNGGSTYTMLPLPGSPIIAAGIGAVASGSMEPIPTIGQWGVICLSIVMVILGVVSIRQEELTMG